MKLDEIRIQNFRCFGDEVIRIGLDSLTAFIGANGCGKTAALQALMRLFGTSVSERTVVPSDFHLPPGVLRDELKADDELKLVIEATLTFPELDKKGDSLDSVAACFKQMSVTSEDGKMFCRVRLEATWTKGNLPEGEVEQKLFWVRSADETPSEKHKTVIAAHDRALIHVHYIPAARDPLKQIRVVSGTILNRMLRAVRWSEKISKAISDSHTTIGDAFTEEGGVAAIEKTINALWVRLHDSPALSEVQLKPIGSRLQEVLQNLQAVFSPGPDGELHELERLSDGQKSMFYLAMVAAAFDIEGKILADDKAFKPHFSVDELNAPVLSLFAMEEPENHISPHFLGRIISIFRELISDGRSQTVITSHSPAVLQRVDPREIRYIRFDSDKSCSSVRPILLPDDKTEAFKFVREAMRAYPELYFSRVVVLGEGDSEEIVLPRIAEALGTPVDTSFVSIAPLGGRHVNHFWKLLSDLDIPHLTLLDLDRERYGGGWSRIEYAMNQLLAVGVPEKELLKVAVGETVQELTREDLDKISERDVEDKVEMNAFITHLERFGVFFSLPLDFDFLMFCRFPVVYSKLPPGADGPSIPEGTTSDPDKAAYKAVIRAVLKPKGGDGTTYSDGQKEAFFWYRYLFLGRGKPATHLTAMAEIAEAELRDKAPQVLKRLCKRLDELLSPPESKEGDET